MLSLITEVQTLPLKLDFRKVRIGTALPTEWLLERTAVRSFEKMGGYSGGASRFAIESPTRVTSQVCFYANMDVTLLSRVI